MFNQKGMSALGLLLTIVVGSFFLTIAFKIGPLYLDNMFIRESIESLEHENFREMTNRQIFRHIGDSFNINNIRDVNVRDMEIERQKHKLLVKLDYEKRIEFMGNVDVVVKFENHFDSSKL